MNQDIIQNFTDPAALINSESQIVAINKKLEQWSIGDIVGMDLPIFAGLIFEIESQEIMAGILKSGSGCSVLSTLEGDIVEVHLIGLDSEGYILLLKKTNEENTNFEISYKSLIARSPIATAIYRPDGSPKYYNEAYGNIWGAPSEMGKALTSNSDYNIFKDEQLDEIGLMPFIQKGFGGETVDIPPVKYNPIKTHVLARFGVDQEKHIKGHIYPVKDDGGCVKEVALVISDITFQMQAEEILTENHLKFQLLTMSLPGVIYEYDFDEDVHFRFVSQGSIEMFGITPEQIIDDYNVISSMIHEDDIEEFNRSSYEAASKGLKWEWQGRFLVNGEIKWIEGKSDKGGTNTKKRYGMLLDVTERVLAEKRSKHNEQLFGQLFNNSPLGLVLLDHKHNVVQVNQGFQEIFGFNQNELKGKKLNNLIVPEEGSQEALDINLITSRGEVGKLESIRLNKAGERIPVIIYGVPVFLENETIGIYGIYVDITQRTRIESELKIRNDELDNFVYKVSHDLRAPLSSILGLVNLARIDDSGQNLRDYIGMIENRIKLLDSFINDVLSHSKNLKFELDVGEVKLRDVIDKCFSDLSYLPYAANIDVKISIRGEPLYSDRWRVNEIFRNLISNAIKYMDPNKDDSFITLDIAISSASAEIRIADNGIGISEHTLPKIFDMFYRATESSEGSGIGLYIVKNAVDKLGGSIKINSEEQKGTTFKIGLPNQKPE
ncbi:MAG: PAS domain-containing sensor histidine kinase [Bacteroidota bacterium]